MSLRQLNLLKKPMLPVPMLPRMLRPCVSPLSREQRSPTPKPSKKPRSTKPAPPRRPKPLILQLSGMPRPGGPPRLNYSKGNMAKSCGTWRSKSSDRKATAKVTSSLLARPPYMPAWQSPKVCWLPPTRFCRGRPLRSTHSPCCQRSCQWKTSLLQQLLPHPCPNSLPGPKGSMLPQIWWTVSLQAEPHPRQPWKGPPSPKGRRSHPRIRCSSRATQRHSARTQTW